MKPYHIETQTAYPNLKQAGKAMDILGLNEANAAGHGFALAANEPKPEITAAQVATLADLPTENPDRSWSFKWATRDKTAEELNRDRESLFQQIKVERQRRIDFGSSFTVPGAADPIALTGRDFDQSVYLALLLRAQGYKAAGVTQPVLTLRDRDDNIQRLTPDQMISLITQAMSWFEQVMTVSWAMKDGTGDFIGGIPDNWKDDVHWP